MLKPEDMVVMNLSGNKVEGNYNPSSDTATHLELYLAFPEIGGLFIPIHLRQRLGSGWKIHPCYGTTHADYFYGDTLYQKPDGGRGHSEYEKTQDLL